MFEVRRQVSGLDKHESGVEQYHYRPYQHIPGRNVKEKKMLKQITKLINLFVYLFDAVRSPSVPSRGIYCPPRWERRYETLPKFVSSFLSHELFWCWRNGGAIVNNRFGVIATHQKHSRGSPT